MYGLKCKTALDMQILNRKITKQMSSNELYRAICLIV